MGCRLAKALTLGALALVLTCVFAGTAMATPSFNGSTLTCEPWSPSGSQRGADVLCKLAVVASDWAGAVNADVGIPPLTTFDPTKPENSGAVPDDPANPTSLHFGPEQLGLMSPGMVKTVIMRLTIKPDAAIGALLISSAHIHSTEVPDYQVDMSKPLKVMHDPADLTPSTMKCQDAGTLPLRAGDDIKCTIQLINKADRQDAVDVAPNALLPDPLTWIAGGNETSHAGRLIQWNTAFLPDGVKAGPPTAPPLIFYGNVPKSLGGNKSVVTNAIVTYYGAESRERATLNLSSQALTTAPDPALLTASTLSCVDANGGDLVRTDPIDCTVVVADAAGYENAADVSATAPVPENAAGDSDPVLVPVDDLGSIPNGTSKSAVYHLRVAADATIGGLIKPTADVHGRSVGTESLINHHLVAPELQVKPRPPADLTPSTMSCDDAGPPPLRPGDDVLCTIQLVDKAGLEDAISISGEATLPDRMQWLEGGNDTTHDTDKKVFWNNSVVNRVPSGPPSATPLTFKYHVPDDTPGGTVLTSTATMNYIGDETAIPGQRKLTSSGLTVAPGPADLVASTLTCTDGNGPPLYGGESLTCSVNVTNAIGHEDIADVKAALDPTELGWGRPDPATIGSDVFGLIRSGWTRSGVYLVKVHSGTPGGTTVTPTAEVTGRSVGSEKIITKKLTAATFIVAARPVAPVQVAPAPVVAAVAPPVVEGPALSVPAPAPVKAASKICGSRRVVNIRVRPPKRKHWKSVTVTFAKKKVKAKKAKSGTLKKKGYFTARLVFQGLPKGPLKVTITGTTTKGKKKKVVSHRTYRLCTKKGAK